MFREYLCFLRLAVISIYLAVFNEVVAFECHRILILDGASDQETLAWASQYCTQVDKVSSEFLTVDLLDALSTSQVVLSDGSDDLIALLALCRHEVVLLLKYRGKLGLKVNDSTVAALGYISCDADIATTLTCWRLPHEGAPGRFQKRTLAQLVRTIGNTSDEFSRAGIELGIDVVSCFNYFNASRSSFTQELAVRIQIDGITELHLAVPNCSLNTIHTFIEAGQGVHIVELELGFFLEQIHQFIPFPRQSHEPSVVSVALPSNPNTNATACHWASALPVHEVPQSDPTATQRTLTTSGLPRDRPLEVAFWDTSLGGTEQQRVWSQVASLLDNHNTFLRVRALAVSPDHATSTATLQAQQWAAHVPTTSFQSELGDSELRVSTADRPRLAAFLNAVDVVVVGGWRGSLWACAFAKSLGATACIVDGPVSPAPLPTHVVDAHLVSSLSDANALRQRGAAVLEVPAAFSPGASPRRAKKDEMKPQVRIALWSGRFDAADAPALFVEACSSLRASQPQLRCWLHGHGPQEAMLRSLADESNIDDATVTFLSDEEPLVPMLQGSRAFVFTAIPGALNQEASAALEKAGRDAAASGLPFVGFGALESFCPEWNGVAASAPTSSALADAMNLALFGTDVTTYSERSLQLARARFMPFTAAMARATALVDVYRALTHVREGSPRAKGVDLTDGLKTMLARSEGQETVRVGFDSEIEGTMVRCEEICRGWPTPPLRQRLHSPWGRLVASPLEVAVVHIRPTEVPDAAFEVGFLQAMRLLESLGKLKFTMLNLMDLNYLDGDTVRNEACSYFEAFDVVFIKSNFQYHVDEFARDFLHACAVPRVLLVSGSYPPAAPEHARFYDLCFFEVFWFENRHLTNHPAAVHAFGIDRRMLLQGAANASNASAPGKAWDLLFIGAMADHAGHKRPHLIGHKSGRRVAVGKADSEEAQAVVADLRRQGVTVLAPLPYSQLAALIQSSATVYVPDDYLGGGERAVLEARTLGVKVQIEPDNPKLAELVTSPIYDHAYYAEQLNYGLGLLDFRLASAFKEARGGA